MIIQAPLLPQEEEGERIHVTTVAFEYNILRIQNPGPNRYTHVIYFD
jgi:hypothetical protein